MVQSFFSRLLFVRCVALCEDVLSPVWVLRDTVVLVSLSASIELRDCLDFFCLDVDALGFTR